jgi:hypothetical protein
MGIRMSRYHTTIPGLGLRPQMGIGRIVMCEREGNKNDVIGCEYGHLRPIDLCITIGVSEKGRYKKKLKKEDKEGFWGNPAHAVVNCWL